MSKPSSGHFSGTAVAKTAESKKEAQSQKKHVRTSPFTKTGHVSITSVRQFREHFMGKSVTDIQKMLEANGYKTTLRRSKNKYSEAQIVVINNGSKQKNISQVQISPGGGRHGKLSYIKISTRDSGIIKVVAGKRKDYKGDKNEKATIIFERNKKHDKS